MVAYNHEPYIEQSLDSVLMQQTSFPIEIILGEDESSDATRAICQRYAAEHPDKLRLILQDRRYISYKDGAPTGVKNLIDVLSAARGEYIALLEGDDYWTDPHKLQSQADFLDTHADCAGCFHDTQVVYEDNTPSHLFRTYHRDRFAVQDTLGVVALLHTSSFFLRRSCLELPEWLLDVLSLDMALFAIVANHGELGYLPGAHSVYRINRQGITHQVRQQSQRMQSSRAAAAPPRVDHLRRYRRHRMELLQRVDAHLGYRYSSKVKESFREHLVADIDLALCEGDRRGARQQFWRYVNTDRRMLWTRTPHVASLAMKVMLPRCHAWLKRLVQSGS